MSNKQKIKHPKPAEDSDQEDHLEPLVKQQILTNNIDGVSAKTRPAQQTNGNNEEYEDGEAPQEVNLDQVKPKRQRGGSKKKKGLPLPLLTGIDDLKALMYSRENPENLKKKPKKEEHEQEEDQAEQVPEEEAEEIKPEKKKKNKKKKVKVEAEAEVEIQGEEEEEIEEAKPQKKKKNKNKIFEVQVQEEGEVEEGEIQEEEEVPEEEEQQEEFRGPPLDVENFPENNLFIMKYGEHSMFVKVTRQSLLLPDKFYKNQRVKKRQENEAKKNDPNIKDYLKDRKIMKYYNQRYFLFTKYDEGISIDYESWYSVTPEHVAKYLAKRLETEKVILDAFCGVGGNTIQFAKKGAKVISNDLDANKIELAKPNAEIYGVLENIDFRNCDFLQLDVSDQEVDVVFLAPPWGGVNYCNQDYSIFESVTPDIKKIMDKAMEINPNNLVFLLGRNTRVDELVLLFSDYFNRHQVNSTINSLEIEKIFINGKLKMIAVYYGAHCKVDRGQEIGYCYNLFGNTPQAKNILKGLFKEKGIRPFLLWYAKQEKDRDFTVQDANNYKEFVTELFATSKVENNPE